LHRALRSTVNVLEEKIHLASFLPQGVPLTEAYCANPERLVYGVLHVYISAESIPARRESDKLTADALRQFCAKIKYRVLMNKKFTTRRMITIEDPKLQMPAFHFEKQAGANYFPDAKKESLGVSVAVEVARNTVCAP
jgi:hypothetical protein